MFVSPTQNAAVHIPPNKAIRARELVLNVYLCRCSLADGRKLLGRACCCHKWPHCGGRAKVVGCSTGLYF
eukprot:5016585-Prymnesium_polylepis.1